MMGDLITVYVKSPSIPAQGVLGDYIDRCIINEVILAPQQLSAYCEAISYPACFDIRHHIIYCSDYCSYWCDHVILGTS